MPYQRTSELPESVTNALPAHAQEMYRKAFNSAWDEYKDPGERRSHSSREEVAHRVAWQAVKKTHKKGDDDKRHPKK